LRKFFLNNFFGIGVGAVSKRSGQARAVVRVNAQG
jgi:hypothetical protein